MCFNKPAFVCPLSISGSGDVARSHQATQHSLERHTRGTRASVALSHTRVGIIRHTARRQTAARRQHAAWIQAPLGDRAVVVVVLSQIKQQNLLPLRACLRKGLGAVCACSCRPAVMAAFSASQKARDLSREFLHSGLFAGDGLATTQPVRGPPRGGAGCRRCTRTCTC